MASFVAALAAFDLLIAPVLALGDDVPDALSVEWQGKKPCEKLFEDAQVRVARCTFPPGTVHLCPVHYLLQSLRSLAAGGRLGRDYERAGRYA
jgi:hypothetical protein